MNWLFLHHRIFLDYFLNHGPIKYGAYGAPTPENGQAELTRLSILIPARNEAAVIGRTIRQILSQSEQQFELILLDDGSSDGTTEAALVGANGDSRLKIIQGNRSGRVAG